MWRKGELVKTKVGDKSGGGGRARLKRGWREGDGCYGSGKRREREVDAGLRAEVQSRGVRLKDERGRNLAGSSGKS